jgi:hypothetical protein
MSISTPNRVTSGTDSRRRESGYATREMGHNALERYLETKAVASPLEEVNATFDDVEHARNKSPRVVLTI